MKRRKPMILMVMKMTMNNNTMPMKCPNITTTNKSMSFNRKPYEQEGMYGGY